MIVPARAGGSLPAAGFRSRRIPVAPQAGYRWRLRVPLVNGVGQATVDSGGAATVTVGPAGLGSRWYPRSVTLSTTTGILDGSSCNIYLGPLLVATAIVGQSAQGGGDVVGVAVPMMQPGDLLTAVWSSAVSGDVATMNVVGDQEALA